MREAKVCLNTYGEYLSRAILGQFCDKKSQILAYRNNSLSSLGFPIGLFAHEDASLLQVNIIMPQIAQLPYTSFQTRVGKGRFSCSRGFRLSS
jgi:hypothetical protein